MIEFIFRSLRFNMRKNIKLVRTTFERLNFKSFNVKRTLKSNEA